MNDSTVYFLAAGNDEFFLCATTDTFNTWTIRTQSSYPIPSYAILDDETIFAVMDDSLATNLMKSTDGGLTWEKKYVQSSWELNQIYFNENNVGLMLFDYPSIIMKSIDFAENWVLQNFHYPLKDIFFFNRSIGFACGGFTYCYFWGCFPPGGDLFYTDNGGRTWYPHYNTKGVELKACLFINEVVGFTLGEVRSITRDHFEINKTTDLGNNWKVVYEDNEDSSGYKFLGNAIFFLDEENWLDGGLGQAVRFTRCWNIRDCRQWRKLGFDLEIPGNG